MIKFLEIIGFIFMSLSIIEIEFVIFLHFAEFYVSGASRLLSEIIYSSSYFPLVGTVLWFIFIISIVIFLIVGFFIFKTARKNLIESNSLAKLMIVIGMVIVIGSLLKMNYLVLLGTTNISTGIPFQSVLYDFSITPLMPMIFWTFFISVNCFLMIISLIITAFGIKWTLVIEETENEDRNTE
ncbi:MAG: hypothetical protein ACW98D_12610 [Promethearchaeota archaeon]|jgi:branched-subunit amino acid ABC-type transport system permease component